jgi:hypothetical protein
MFFGDIHVSTTNSCSQPCQDIDSRTGEILNPGETRCMDISSFLSNLFQKAESKGEYIDFYLEIPFLAKNRPIPSRNFLANRVPEVGYIPKLFAIFYDCFTKNYCNFKYVRFHYVDVRNQYQRSDIHDLVMRMHAIIKADPRKLVPMRAMPGYSPLIEEVITSAEPETATTTWKFATFENYLTERYEKYPTAFVSERQGFVRTGRHPYFEITDLLIRATYSSDKGAEPRNFQLFHLMLTSNDYAADARRLFADVLRQLDTPSALEVDQILVNVNLLVNRHGANMHRIRAQLFELELEGKEKEAANIVDFISKLYRANSTNGTILAGWQEVMNFYVIFISTATTEEVNKQFAQLTVALNKFPRERIVPGAATVTLDMDAYTLARMERTYPAAKKGHVPSKLVVVYAGNHHIDTYLAYYSQVEGIQFTGDNPNNLVPYSLIPDPIRCLTIDASVFTL